MERGKKIARQFFEELKFSVDDIPETDEKRADLDVTDTNEQYIVEVKEKIDTGSQLTELPHSYPNSDRKITREPHAASNRLDGILKSGRKQLDSTPSSGDAFNIIFMVFIGPNADMFVRRSLYTFYGVQDVMPRSEPGDGLNCVYFHNSFAFSSPSVNGVILVENRDLQLCINEFSPNFESFLNSRLVEKMGNATMNPRDFDSDPGKVVLRSDISRKTEGEILDALHLQTGVKYSTITLSRYNL